MSLFTKFIAPLFAITLIGMPMTAIAGDSFGFGINVDKNGRSTIIFGFSVEPQKRTYYDQRHNDNWFQNSHDKSHSRNRHNDRSSSHEQTLYAVFRSARDYNGRDNIVRMNNGTSVNVGFARDRCNSARHGCVYVYADTWQQAARKAGLHR